MTAHKTDVSYSFRGSAGMKHAILGAGAIGGLVGTALASLGEDVTVVVRPEKLPSYPAELSLERPSGSLTAPAKAVATLTEPVDVLWIATKTYQLQTALEAVPVSPRLRGSFAEWSGSRRGAPGAIWTGARSPRDDRGGSGEDCSGTIHPALSVRSPQPRRQRRATAWEPSSHSCAILDSPASSFRTSRLCCGASFAFWRPWRW